MHLRFELGSLGLVALASVASGLLSEPAAEAASLKVVATIPDLADITKAIGGERVEVTSIARGRENLHAVTARPSNLVAMSRADLFVEVGLSLEVAFVPGLIEGCRNANIQPGAKGFVMVSQGWEALDVPASVSRKGGDLHPQGNPHMNMDPRAGRHIAQQVFEGLMRVDPGSKAFYEERLRVYSARLDEAEARWKELAKGWQGRKVAVYHLEYNYLCNDYGIEIVGSIELKPGIPATPNHLAELIASMKAQECRAILTAPWSNNNDVDRVAEETGATVVELPNQCGGMQGAETWIGMMDLVHQRLAAVLGGAASSK